MPRRSVSPLPITTISSIGSVAENLDSPTVFPETSFLQVFTPEASVSYTPGSRADVLRPFLPSPPPVGRFQTATPGPRSGVHTHYTSPNLQSGRDAPSRLSSPYVLTYAGAGYPTATSSETGYPAATILGDPTPQPDPMTVFWSAYNSAGDREDKTFVKASGGDLDTLLIFAGLFSAINTAFIIDAYKSLKADPLEETNKLIRTLILATQNPASPAIAVGPDQFEPTSRDIRINTCFFVSLCCSLTAAFGAVLAKQWLTQYDADGEALKPPSDRARERQLKYENLKYWGLEHVVVTLPTLLQLSLFFFLVGLADLVWPLEAGLAFFVTAFTALTFLFWLMTILISTIRPSSPFQTRLSHLLRPVYTSLVEKIPRALSGAAKLIYDNPFANFRSSPYTAWPSILARLVMVGVNAVVQIGARIIIYLRNARPQDGHLDSGVDSRCVAYLVERETLPLQLDMLAQVLDSLSNGMDCAAVARSVITFHLKPSHEEWWHLPGLYGPARKPLLKILHTLFLKWRYLEVAENTPIHSFPPMRSHTFLYSLRPELSKSSLMFPEDAEAHELIVEILQALPPFSPRDVSDYEWYAATKWLEDFISPHLPNDREPVLQQCSLRLLVAASAPFNPRQTFRIVQQNLQACTGIEHYISSTMWVDHHKRTVNMDNIWMGILRVQILSVAPGGVLESGFAEYLAAWFKHYAMPDWRMLVRDRDRINRQRNEEEEQKWVYWSYLLALRQILSGHDAQKWSQELVKHGHEACLRIILQDFPHESPFLGAPFALRYLLSLWAQPGPGRTLDQSPKLSPTEEHIAMVVGAITVGGVPAVSANILQPYSPIFFAEKSSAMIDSLLYLEFAETVQWISSYLEAAMSRAGMPLVQETASAGLPWYRRWCEEADQHMENCPCMELYERLEKIGRVISDEVEAKESRETSPIEDTALTGGYI